MMRTTLAGLLVLLTSVVCAGQTPIHGLVAGQSVRTDVERVAGKPVVVHTQTLVEYQPYAFDPKTWQSNISKMYVQYRVDSPIVERIELLMAQPIKKTDTLKSLEASTTAARQPNMPDQPATRGKNGTRLVEYFGAPYFIVLTFEGPDENSGVSRTARYSKLLFDSTVSSLGADAPRGASSPSLNAGANVSVTGHWAGVWINSHGESGQSSMNLKEDNGTITGEEDSYSQSPSYSPIHINGRTIVNGRRNGNVLTWEFRNQFNNCRDYIIRWELSPDGKLANGTYNVTDRCAKQSYSGSYLNFHR
jgi:hypothetical protein